MVLAPSRVCWKVEQQRSVTGTVSYQVPWLRYALEVEHPVGGDHGAGLSVFASRSDLSSLHALQAGLVWVCSVLSRS